MSDLQGGTIKERLARLEVIMCNHIARHEAGDRARTRIISGLVVGLIMAVLPGFVKWMAGVL